MTNVISLDSKLKLRDPELAKLVELSSDIDQVMMFYLSRGCDAKEVAVIVGHRLSELLRVLPAHNLEVKESVIGILNSRVK